MFSKYWNFRSLTVVNLRGKYGAYQSRTDNVTERTRFSKSRSNDLENISQGQRSSHGTHHLMPLIICTNYGKIPSWTVNATGRSRKVNGQTGGQTDIQTDRQGESNPPPPPPPNFVAGVMKRFSSIRLDTGAEWYMIYIYGDCMFYRTKNIYGLYKWYHFTITLVQSCLQCNICLECSTNLI